MRTIVPAVFIVLLSLTGFGATHYVPTDFPEIQTAILASSDGDTVIVLPGTYTENISFLGKAITVKSQDGPRSTVIDGGHKGSVVTFDAGEGPDTLLSGFTIRNGSGTGFPCRTYSGGGIYCKSASPTITLNVIRDNVVDNRGGGIYCSASSSLISGNTFRDNKAKFGGGVHGHLGDVDIIGNIFRTNTATAWGGGIYCSESDQVEDNILIKNTADDAGGGIYCSGGTLLNNLFADNESFYGGGVRCGSGYPVFITHCTLVGNSAVWGGGVYCAWSTLTVTNSIFWNDNATHSGDEIHLADGLPAGYSKLVAEFSDLKGGKSSVEMDPWSLIIKWYEMIDTDPLFADGSGHDFHLTHPSPCRNRGTNGAPHLPPEDFEGDPRIWQGTADMGADEFHYHFYHTGDAAPGGSVELKIVGPPLAGPVGLLIGSGVLDPPLPTVFGDWYLVLPFMGPFLLGGIPAGGVLVLPGTLPVSPPGPYDLPMQVILLGALSNLDVLQVD